MGKTNLSWISKIKGFAFKYEPEILIGMGIAGFITTSIMSAKAALSRKRKIDQIGDDITKKEKSTITLKSYVPPVIVGAASAACVIGGTTIKFKRYSALATAFALSEAAAKEYQDKVTELIGQRKEESLRNDIKESKIANDDRPSNPSNVIITKNGDMRCYDLMSDRYFNSDIEKIRRSVNDLNRRMRDDGYISLNDFYEEIGLPSITIGDILGWNITHGYIELDFSSHLSPDGIPCLSINFNRSSRPIPDYDKY